MAADWSIDDSSATTAAADAVLPPTPWRHPTSFDSPYSAADAAYCGGTTRPPVAAAAVVAVAADGADEVADCVTDSVTYDDVTRGAAVAAGRDARPPAPVYWTGAASGGART